MKVAFVTNLCPHYRVKTFELLAQQFQTDFFFYSAADEWYWQQSHGTYTGSFSYHYLPGTRIGRTRIAPTLPWELWHNDYDVYIKCINGRFALPVTYAIARLKRKPFILWTGIWTRLQTPMHQLFFPVTNYFYHHADAIVTYGDHVKRYLISEQVPSARIFSTTHAVDNDLYSQSVSTTVTASLRQELDLLPHQQVILYLGRLEQGKGLNYLLEAFAQLSHQSENAVLVLAGSGAEEEPLKQFVASAGLQTRVRFCGYVPTNQTLAYYSIASVFVLPSVTTPTFKEPWGLVVNEAFNQGVPVVTTDAVGAAAGGLVRNGVNGLIVPERNSSALADALMTLFTNEQRRVELAMNARSLIATWNNQTMVAGFTQAIEYVSSTAQAQQMEGKYSSKVEPMRKFGSGSAVGVRSTEHS